MVEIENDELENQIFLDAMNNMDSSKAQLVLYIIRGVPGSGKSTLASLIAPEHNYSADDYFVDKKTGKYTYDPTKLDKAHKECNSKVYEAMVKGVEVIAVANTFVKRWEYQPYIDMATKLGYVPVEIICRGNFNSVHNVPSEKVKSMMRNFEY